MHRAPESDGGSGGRELPERHRALTASALRERQLLLEEYIAQYSQVRQLMRQQREEEGRSPGAESHSETELTPVHLSGEKFLVQPTPEREENLEEYLMRRSYREGSPVLRAGKELFHWQNEPSNRHGTGNAPAVGNTRQSPEPIESAMLESGITEGLSAAVQREREKYASLLERRRVLQETQMRIAEHALSPGPPPLPGTHLCPQYRVYRSDSDMELASLADNGNLTTQPDYLETDIPIHHHQHQQQQQSGRCVGGDVRVPPHLLIHPSHSLPAVMHRTAEETDPLDPVPVPSHTPPAAREHSVLHEIADSLSQLLQFQQQQQQQQQLQKQEELLNTAPLYTNSVPQTQFAPPTTPLQQFTSYPPSTPGLPPHQHVQYLPPPYGSTPHHIPFFPGCLPPAAAAAPSPMPYCSSVPPYPYLYPGYPSPSPFYAPSAPACMYHSLPSAAAAAAGLYPANQWAHSVPSSLPVPPPAAPLLLTPPLSQQSRVPVAANCTQTDLTFLENPLSSQQQHHQLDTVREDQLVSVRRQLPALPPASQLRGEVAYSSGDLPAAPVAQRPAAGTHSDGGPQESPLFDQVRERIYSEVASLVSENEARPYYLMELLRAAQLLNTDYLRQAGLSSLKRVINNFLNSDRLDAEAFSASLSARQESPEGVYSPTQNFPLSRHYLDTNLSDSSGPAAGERCLSRGYCRHSATVGQPGCRGQEGGSDISEITTSDLSCDEFACVSPWEQQVRVLVTRLIPLLKEHLELSCSPRLLALIHCEIMCLLSELFPEEMVLRVRSLLDRDLKTVLSRYSSQRLRDCGEELLVDVSDLFFSQVDPLALTLSGSFGSEPAGGTERESRDRARDDALATAPMQTPPVQREQTEETDKPGDETFTLSASTMDGLLIEGHTYPESVPPVPSSPTLSPPRINIISLTLSESRPLDEGATSERSEDYSRSRTVDTVSETASCTASDLSEAPPSLLPVPVPSSPPPMSSLSAVPPVGDSASSSDSDELPPFASTCLSQGSFTLIPSSTLAPGIVDVLSDEPAGLEFTAEVLSLTCPTQLELTGDSTAIQTPQ